MVAYELLPTRFHEKPLANLDTIALQVVPRPQLVGVGIELPSDAEQRIATLDSVVKRLSDECSDGGAEPLFRCGVSTQLACPNDVIDQFRWARAFVEPRELSPPRRDGRPDTVRCEKAAGLIIGIVGELGINDERRENPRFTLFCATPSAEYQASFVA